MSEPLYMRIKRGKSWHDVAGRDTLLCFECVSMADVIDAGMEVLRQRIEDARKEAT